MLRKSPSGALSPYYYKGGYFHGIHYGSYFNDMESLRDMISKEEAFIMNKSERQRIMIDLYETNLSDTMVLEFARHIKRMNSRIVKLAIAGDKKLLKAVYKALLRNDALNRGQICICSDMEEGKTWLVSEQM